MIQFQFRCCQRSHHGPKRGHVGSQVHFVRIESSDLACPLGPGCWVLNMKIMGDVETVATLLMPQIKDIEMPHENPISCHVCPALQDINGDSDIAYVLSRSEGRSNEDILSNILNAADLELLREARYELFKSAIGPIIECDPDSDCLSDLKLKRRRGQRAPATIAMDMIYLFQYLCGIADFPIDMFTNNDLLDGLIWTNRRRPIDLPLSPSPSLDLPCGQAGGAACSPAGAIPTTTSTIGSPFLDDDQTPASRRKAAHELSPIPLNLSACSDSFTINADSTGSSRGTCPISQAIADTCCDHGRAILDLRCTVDLIQYQLIELQKKTAMFCDSKGNTTPAQNKDRISSNNGEMSPSDSIKDVLLSPPDSRLPNESSVDNTSPESSCTFSDILSIATPNKTVGSLRERAGTGSTVIKLDRLPALSILDQSHSSMER